MQTQITPSQITLPESAVIQQDNQLRTTSLKVADAFGKRHAHVLRKLETIECSPEFSSAHFWAHDQEVTIGKGAKRLSKVYEMTKDGFMFLVMGFTGKKAAAIKEAYINEFNRMAATLNQITRKAAPKTKPGQLTLDQQVSIKELVKARVEALPHPKQAGAAIRCWSALKSKFGCSYKQIPIEQFTEAASLVARLPLDGELLLRQDTPAQPQIARLDELKDQGNLIAMTEQELLHVRRLMGRMVSTHDIFNRYELYRVSQALGSRFGVEMLDQVSEGHCDAYKLRHLEPLMNSVYAKRVGGSAGVVFA